MTSRHTGPAPALSARRKRLAALIIVVAAVLLANGIAAAMLIPQWHARQSAAAGLALVRSELDHTKERPETATVTQAKVDELLAAVPASPELNGAVDEVVRLAAAKGVYCLSVADKSGQNPASLLGGLAAQGTGTSADAVSGATEGAGTSANAASGTTGAAGSGASGNPGTGYTEISLEFKIGGGLSALIDFFDELHRTVRLLEIADWNITEGGGSGMALLPPKAATARTYLLTVTVKAYALTQFGGILDEKPGYDPSAEWRKLQQKVPGLGSAP